jgi:hypothetical protein
MEIFILWIILSFLIGNWSNNRGNGFAYGFFWSLLLSPIIGFIAVIAKSPKYKCGKCGYISPVNSAFCPSCGKDRDGHINPQIRQNEPGNDLDQFWHNT